MAQHQVAVDLDRLQEEHDLTSTEMLQAVVSWQQTCLRYMVREERTADPMLVADEP